MVCVVCSCATSPYREVCRAKGGIGSGETLCHDIYFPRPITTVSVAANTAGSHLLSMFQSATNTECL